MGCAAWSDQARRELRASGETSRRRDLAASDQLTAQELQIAQLAAQGLSNRDIALKRPGFHARLVTCVPGPGDPACGHGSTRPRPPLGDVGRGGA